MPPDRTDLLPGPGRGAGSVARDRTAVPVAAARTGTPVLRRRVAVMGSTAEITLVGAGVAALARAVARLHDLEARWSRFRADSEVSRLNAAAGMPQRVSGETLLLVDLAQRGWRETGGRYDPTLLDVVRRAGYDDDFAHLPAQRPAAPAVPGAPGAPVVPAAPGAPVVRAAPGAPVVPGAPGAPADAAIHDPATCGRIVLDHAARAVCLPAGAGFDPGGIGKGLAADLLSADLAAAGVRGGCVNVGGDLRVWGPAPHGGAWRVAAAGRTLALSDAAVATSGTGRRAWTVAGRRMHHLIDPTTLAPADTGVTAVTVVAPAAWRAEVYALAALLAGVDRALADLRRWGVAGLVVDRHGVVHASDRLRAPA